MSERSATDVHGLAPAYAVDAVDEEERARVAAHLRECEDCRRDVGEFRETLARLGDVEAVAPNEELWQRIRQRTRSVPQLSATPTTTEDPHAAHPDTGSGDAPATRRGVPWWRRPAPLGWAAAVLLVLAVAVSAVLGSMLTSTNDELSALQTRNDKLEALLAASDTQRMESEMPPDSTEVSDSAEVTVFVSRDMDGAMVIVDGLEPPPDGMGYQVWYIDPDDDMRSAGMLRDRSNGTMTRLFGDLGEATQLGITMEPAEGAANPSKTPMKVDV